MKRVLKLCFILLLFSMAVHSAPNYSQPAGLARLRKSYSWPAKKPPMDPYWQSMFGNGDQMSLVIRKDMKLIIELGSWLGASTMFILDNAPQATVIAVDHWQGSEEHQWIPLYKDRLDTLYETFLVNCWQYQERLIPLRANTLDGLQEIYEHGLVPDLVYVDAAHDYESVLADLEKIYKCFPTAMITGDDWTWDWHLVPENKKPKNAMSFPTQKAVLDFTHRHKLAVRVVGNFWWIF